MSCLPEDQKQTNSQSGCAGEALGNGMTSYVAHMDTVLKKAKGGDKTNIKLVRASLLESLSFRLKLLHCFSCALAKQLRSQV